MNIEKIAREAGFKVTNGSSGLKFSGGDFEKFAQLVAEEEREAIASDATLLRRIKTEQNALKDTLAEMRVERDTFRARATKAEQESAEWKARFDILLRRDGANA